ncbi:MAG: hypothetical protein GY760_25780 [Deltaproteobacteria bacterium]|nr:hypothetical protein [Deltaproteobacteria bacterium]
MAGYFGYSKSNNAISAEENDRFPLTKAKKVLAKKLGWTQAKSEQFLKKIGTDEYHHCSKQYNIVDFYDVSDDFVNEYKEEIESFVYKKPKKEPKKLYFKCWNYDRDIRNWDYKITNRHSNNCHNLCEVKKDIEKMKLQYLAQSLPDHKTKLRIYKETVSAIDEILQEINKHEGPK